MQCKKCGGSMIGDGYTKVLHCEYVEDTSELEPDAGPVYCDYVDEEKPEDLPAYSLKRQVNNEPWLCHCKGDIQGHELQSSCS